MMIKKIILPIITSLLIMPICLSTEEAFKYITSPQVIQNRMEDLERALDIQKTKTNLAELKLSNLQSSSTRKAKRREERIVGLKKEVKKYEGELKELKRDVEEREQKIVGLKDQVKKYDADLKKLERDVEERANINEKLKQSEASIKKEHKLALEKIEEREGGYNKEIFRLKQELVSLTLKNKKKQRLNLVDKNVQTDHLTTSSTPIPETISVSRGVATDDSDNFSVSTSENKNICEEKGWSTPKVAGISILGATITLLIYHVAKANKQKKDALQKGTFDEKEHGEKVK